MHTTPPHYVRRKLKEANIEVLKKKSKEVLGGKDLLNMLRESKCKVYDMETRHISHVQSVMFAFYLVFEPSM